MKVDYRNTPDGQDKNPVIPAGVYEVEIIGVKEMINQNSGNDVWIIKSKVISGDYKDSKIDDFNTFTPALDSANKGMFKAFGFPVDTQELDIQPEQLIGKQVKVTVNQEMYKGELQNKVERFGGYQPLGREYINKSGLRVEPGKKDDDMSDIPF